MKNSLALKLAAIVLIFSTLIMGAVLTNSYLFSRALIIEQAEENSRSRGRAMANRLAALIKPIEHATRNIALALADFSLTDREISSLAHLVVENNPDVFGMAIAFEPYTLGHNRLFFAPYSSRKNDSVTTGQLGNSGYRYFYKDWYQLPRELQQPIWTEPYSDRGGAEAFIATYSVPFYRMHNGQKQFAGVVRADISLDWLQEMVSKIKLYDTGYAAVLSRNGTYIYHPLERLIFNETVFSLAEGRNDQELWKIGRNMIEGKTGFVERASVRDNKDSFLFYMPLPIGGWSLAFLFPTDEVLKDANELTRNTLLIGIIGFLLFTAAIIFISRRMVKPIRDLSDAALEIAGGNLNTVLPEIVSRDEVGKLSESFGFMQKSLREFIDDLKQTTAAKERIESELRIAHDIQMSILPKIFPPFPDHKEFDIFATLKPAREVGGDLYDFFFIDEHHFCFLIGDVSGKGVPAAFLMAVTKTLLKVIAEQDLMPGEILEKANNDLAEDNESCMFVTLFLAILDIRNGNVAYGSAGHNPPVLLSNDRAVFLEPLNEPIAGAMPDMIYSTRHMTLAPGETLFLYTDGVTEAMTLEQELYSDQRLLRFLNNSTGDHPGDMIQAVTQSITEFAGKAEQSDDITMLALKYTGG